MVELKPCPFCGGKAQVAPDEIGSGGQHVPPYHAGCFCGGGCGFVFTADDPDEAAASWNRRTLSTITPAEVGGLVERLRSEANAAQFSGRHTTASIMREAATALEAQATRIAELEDGLEFYADISKYPAPLTGGMGALWSDCGQIARRALTGGQNG